MPFRRKGLPRRLLSGNLTVIVPQRLFFPQFHQTSPDFFSPIQKKVPALHLHLRRSHNFLTRSIESNTTARNRRRRILASKWLSSTLPVLSSLDKPPQPHPAKPPATLPPPPQPSPTKPSTVVPLHSKPLRLHQPGPPPQPSPPSSTRLQFHLLPHQSAMS